MNDMVAVQVCYYKH